MLYLSLYLATSSKEAILVVETGTGTFGWRVSKEPYTCTVGVAKKGAKFAGLKPFMNYPLTPSFSNIQVQNDSVQQYQYTVQTGDLIIYLSLGLNKERTSYRRSL